MHNSDSSSESGSGSESDNESESSDDESESSDEAVSVSDEDEPSDSAESDEGETSDDDTDEEALEATSKKSSSKLPLKIKPKSCKSTAHNSRGEAVCVSGKDERSDSAESEDGETSDDDTDEEALEPTSKTSSSKLPLKTTPKSSKSTAHNSGGHSGSQKIGATSDDEKEEDALRYTPKKLWANAPTPAQKDPQDNTAASLYFINPTSDPTPLYESMMNKIHLLGLVIDPTMDRGKVAVYIPDLRQTVRPTQLGATLLERGCAYAMSFDNDARIIRSIKIEMPLDMQLPFYHRFFADVVPKEEYHKDLCLFGYVKKVEHPVEMSIQGKNVTLRTIDIYSPCQDGSFEIVTISAWRSQTTNRLLVRGKLVFLGGLSQSLFNNVMRFNIGDKSIVFDASKFKQRGSSRSS